MQALTAMAPASVKVLAVDTACQVPMQTVKCSASKAYIFRSATEKPRKERMEGMPYSDAGQIRHIAPYAPQGEGAAAGAEDHPDAEGPSLPLPLPLPSPIPFPLLLPCCYHHCSCNTTPTPAHTNVHGIRVILHGA
jgi:hypothetical protein